MMRRSFWASHWVLDSLRINLHGLTLLRATLPWVVLIELPCCLHQIWALKLQAVVIKVYFGRLCGDYICRIKSRLLHGLQAEIYFLWRPTLVIERFLITRFLKPVVWKLKVSDTYFGAVKSPLRCGIYLVYWLKLRGCTGISYSYDRWAMIFWNWL